MPRVRATEDCYPDLCFRKKGEEFDYDGPMAPKGVGPLVYVEPSREERRPEPPADLHADVPVKKKRGSRKVAAPDDGVESHDLPPPSK
jgi:hypothetical protein